MSDTRIENIVKKLVAKEYPAETWDEMSYVLETAETYQWKIAKLEEIIQRARTNSNLSSEGCPLCKYENGVFKEYCTPHKEMEDLRYEKDNLSKMLNTTISILRRHNVTVPEDTDQMILNSMMETEQ